MKKLYRNLRDVRRERIDILTEGDTIIRVSPLIEGDYDTHTFDGDTYVSAGWIDCHTHACDFYPPYSSDIDEIGWKRGVTTLIDAGSVGALDIDRYHEEVKNYRTNVFSLINVSEIGLKELDELKDMQRVRRKPVEEACRRYEDFIVGLKVRVSASIVGENGADPLREALEWNKDIGKRVMVHVGSAPPSIGEVLEEADENTIITHCMNGKSNNLLTEERLLRAAIDRGVWLDVGHGSASFSWEIGDSYREKGIKPNTISTDIYNVNMDKGPVYDLATTMNKFLALGYSLEEVVDRVTKAPAEYFGLKGRGIIEEGAVGELTFFRIKDKVKKLRDSHGYERDLRGYVVPIGVRVKGRYHSLED